MGSYFVIDGQKMTLWVLSPAHSASEPRLWLVVKSLDLYPTRHQGKQTKHT